MYETLGSLPVEKQLAIVNLTWCRARLGRLLMPPPLWLSMLRVQYKWSVTL